uniref:Uncharacterized protein n=1 Tax=Cacopsylla melanoneura TaxID=428564 RepID=A0A8D8VIB1_9HEMI
MDSLDSEAGKYEAIGQIDYYVNDNEDDAIEGIFSRVFVRYSQYQQTLNYKRRKQNKTDSEDEEDIEEEEEDDEYLEEVLEETENEDSVIREEFDIQWAENGQDIILKLWIEKYKDFVDPNFIDNSLDNNTEESVEKSTIDRLNESVNSVDHTEKIVTEDVYDHVNDIDNVSIDDEVNKINGNFAKQISLETNEPNILLNEIEYQNTNSSVNLETDIKNQDCTVQDNTKEISGDYGTEWDQLWQNHCIEVYNSHFDTFKQDWIRNLAETLTQANNSTGLEYFELVKQEALTTLQKRGQGRRNQTGETSNQHQTNDLKLSDETQTQDKKPKGYKRDFQKSSLVDFIENNLVELVNKYDDQPPTLIDNCDAQQPTLVDNCDAEQPTLVGNCDAEHPNVGDKVRGAHPNPFQCDNVDSSVNKNCERIEQNKTIEIQNERTEGENNPKDLEPDSTKNNSTANSFDRKGIEKNTKEVQEYIDSQDTEEKTKESEESQTGEEPNAEDDEINSTPLTSYSKFINEPNYLLNKLGLHFGSATESTDSSLLSTEDRKVPSPFYKRQELSLFVSKSKFKTMNFRLKIDTKDEAMEEKCDAYDVEDFERNREYGEKYEEKDSERITGYDFKYNEFDGKINLPKNESDETSFSCGQTLNKTEPDEKTRLPLNRHTYFKYSDDEECSGSLDSSKTNGGSGVKDVIKERHSDSANMYRTIEENIDTAGKDNIVKNKEHDEDKTGIKTTLMECHEDILSNKMSLAENKDERVDKNAEEDLSDDIKEGPEELEIIKDLNGTETVHIDWTNFDESMQTYNETHDSLQTKRKRNKKKKKK